MATPGSPEHNHGDLGVLAKTFNENYHNEEEEKKKHLVEQQLANFFCKSSFCKIANRLGFVNHIVFAGTPQRGMKKAIDNL